MKSLFLISSILLSVPVVLNSLSAPSHSNKAPMAVAMKRADAAAGLVGEVSIVIDKSDYELAVYDAKGWYATFPVVFGNNSLEDKKYQGDKNTPEGNFKIVSKRVHNKWCRYMGIDYPTKDSYERFNRRKTNHEIPASANIGGSIGIHGTWPNDDIVVDYYRNWTEGCISMKNSHLQEIYSMIPVGASVIIRK